MTTASFGSPSRTFFVTLTASTSARSGGGGVKLGSAEFYRPCPLNSTKAVHSSLCLSRQKWNSHYFRKDKGNGTFYHRFDSWFWVLLIFPFMVIFQFSYLLPCTTRPACQPEAIGWGMAIKVGSKFRRIGVPTQDSFSSRVLKVCNLGRVEARY